MIVIGAEAWCQKCQRLRPAFEAVCKVTVPPHVAWLWLDLEEHADFLSGFIPPDLPLLLRWRDGLCVQAAVVVNIDPDAAPFDRVRLNPLSIEGAQLRDPHQGALIELPQLWSEFAVADWAKG